jgi:hypothetical protein
LNGRGFDCGVEAVERRLVRDGTGIGEIGEIRVIRIDPA